MVAAMPSAIKPMLCTLTDRPVQDEDYLYEYKWDGYRIVAYVDHKKVKLISRGGKDYSSRYPVVVKALQKLQVKAVIDGEMVVFGKDGNPDFHALQLYNGSENPISYVVFDLLWLNGHSTMGLPLVQRKNLLETLVDGQESLLFSQSFEDGDELFSQVQKRGLEGIVAKRKDSIYLPDRRGNDWLKVPTRTRQEFVIGAWVESDNGRLFKSLLFGAWADGKFRWVGRSGGGYKHKDMPGILAQLKPLETDKNPFANKVLDAGRDVIHWMKPELVANFEFADWTNTGRIRKPATFLGFRLDKKAEDVVLEVPKPAAQVEADVDEQKKPVYLNKDSNWKRVDESWAGKEKHTYDLEKGSIELHDVARELWKGVKKADLILYYFNMCSYILPYIQDRPQSLVLKLTHAGGPRTFVKDMEGRQPENATVYTEARRHRKAGKRNIIDYLVCNNLETLLFMVDVGCVDLNPWASRTTQIEYPDYLWIELDPTIPEKLPKTQSLKEEDAGFKKAITVAKAVKRVLDQHKLTGFLKTSGQTGLHIYIPCEGFTFGQTRVMAAMLAKEVEQVVPKTGTTEESKDHRGTKVYIDAGQNDHADTLAAPYAVRPYHWPLVSTPLDWKELTTKLDRKAFTMHNIAERLEKKGDFFKGVLDPKIRKQNSKQLAKLLTI